LIYEPDSGGYQATLDLDTVGAMLGGRPVSTRFGSCLVIDRRYEGDRFHGDIRIEDCELQDADGLHLLDPSLDLCGAGLAASSNGAPGLPTLPSGRRTLFIDLETTGLSGGAGTIAFLVGCGYFDLGAFQVRQFLLASYAAERALLAAVADFFEDADLIVTYNGKTFDLPVMETRWLFHRMQPPLDGVPHFDMLHPARRLWRNRGRSERRVAPPVRPGLPDDSDGVDDACCRLSTLERLLFDVRRVGDVPGLEIPGRFFTFVRSGDPRPLEPVLEHNRLDLVSLAAVTARAARLAQHGHEACRDCCEALALGRVYERAESFDRAEACYRRAASSESTGVRAEALYRLGLRYRRDRRFEEAADVWRMVLAWTARARGRRQLEALRQFAAEALAIHLEHRRRDLSAARTHALFALDESNPRRAEGVRHRIARIDRKMTKKKSPGSEDPGLLPGV
jgi:tetratricopeptide (TPR) repeat protein